MPNTDTPIRVLHYVNQWSNQGGIESWLMNIYRLSDPAQVAHHLLIPKSRYQSTTHDALFKQYGVRHLDCEHFARNRGFHAEFAGVCRQHGPFDVVHAHNDYVGGPVVRLAERLGVPVRITHAHNDTRPGYRASSFLRKRYIDRSHRWVARHATHGFAASEAAGLALYGKAWGHDPRWHALYYGIDLDRFDVGADRSAVRASLGIPDDAFVVGHVGRFHPQKNHDLLMATAERVLAQDPGVYFVLIGDGDLRPQVEQQARAMPGGERIRFLGIRDDVPTVMCAAMDMFLFPSRWEGLGIVLIEAQAAGLPYVASDVVPREADILEGFGTRHRLDEPAEAWAESVMRCKAQGAPMTQRQALSALRGGTFDSNTSAARLMDFYRDWVDGP
ncbi:MAG: glycosyltransferase [Phycisphaeraceae bacterium]